MYHIVRIRKVSKFISYDYIFFSFIINNNNNFLLTTKERDDYG